MSVRKAVARCSPAMSDGNAELASCAMLTSASYCLKQEGGTAAAALQESAVEITAAGDRAGASEPFGAGSGDNVKANSLAIEPVRMAPQRAAGAAAAAAAAPAADAE